MSVVNERGDASLQRRHSPKDTRVTPLVPEHGRNGGSRSISYFDDDTDEARYEAVDTHDATQGIVVSLALGLLLWAFIGVGVGWL